MNGYHWLKSETSYAKHWYIKGCEIPMQQKYHESAMKTKITEQNITTTHQPWRGKILSPWFEIVQRPPFVGYLCSWLYAVPIVYQHSVYGKLQSLLHPSELKLQTRKLFHSQRASCRPAATERYERNMKSGYINFSTYAHPYERKFTYSRYKYMYIFICLWVHCTIYIYILKIIA